MRAIKLPTLTTVTIKNDSAALICSARWWCRLKWISLKSLHMNKTHPDNKSPLFSSHLTRWYSISLKNKIADNSQTQRRKGKGRMRVLFSTAGVLSLTTQWLLLNNHTLWPSISGSPPFRIFHACHQASHFDSNQRQFANTLYTACIIMLYILMAICYCKALPPAPTRWIFIEVLVVGREGIRSTSVKQIRKLGAERLVSVYTQKPVQLQALGCLKKSRAPGSHLY